MPRSGQRKLHRFLCYFAIISYFSCFILILFLIIILLPFIIVFYVPWMICDRHTPERGGRRCAWLRHLGVRNYIRDYFHYTLVKTTDLEADRHYIFCFQPHGGIYTGLLLHFCTEATGFSELFPGLTPHALNLPMAYKFPLLRELCLLLGACSASSESIDYLLSSLLAPFERLQVGKVAHRTRGCQVVALAVGGQHEMLDAHPGSFRLTLRDRRGFARKALQHGADLVPVYSFGENDLMKQVNNPVGRC